jgi:hypothetical protein
MVKTNPRKIENLTKKYYLHAKRVVEKYRKELESKISAEQAKCKHETNHSDFYRYWYDENHLINVCRNCFYKWDEGYRPFLLKDYGDLTEGKFKRTEEDRENSRKYIKYLEKIIDF